VDTPSALRAGQLFEPVLLGKAEEHVERCLVLRTCLDGVRPTKGHPPPKPLSQPLGELAAATEGVRLSDPVDLQRHAVAPQHGLQLAQRANPHARPELDVLQHVVDIAALAKRSRLRLGAGTRGHVGSLGTTGAVHRWQGGEAVAAAERPDPLRGDPSALVGSLDERPHGSAAPRWHLIPQHGAPRRPVARRSEADAGRAGMDVGKLSAQGHARAAGGGALDPVEPNSATSS